MQLDAANVFGESIATGSTGTNNLGDVIDLAVERDIGAGQPVFANAVVQTAIAAGTGGTYQVKVVSADDAALSSNVVEHVTSAEFDAASGIAAGQTLLNVALPAEVAGGGYGRYLGVQEVVGTAATSAGAVDVYLSHDQRAYQAYPNQV